MERTVADGLLPPLETRYTYTPAPFKFPRITPSLLSTSLFSSFLIAARFSRDLASNAMSSIQGLTDEITERQRRRARRLAQRETLVWMSGSITTRRRVLTKSLLRWAYFMQTFEACPAKPITILTAFLPTPTSPGSATWLSYVGTLNSNVIKLLCVLNRLLSGILTKRLLWMRYISPPYNLIKSFMVKAG